MPESLDQFIAAELLKWGSIKVVSVQDTADCVMSFGHAPRTEVTSTGSATVPKDTTVTGDSETLKLPNSQWGATVAKSAAVELVHRDSSIVLCADAQSDNWSWRNKGPKVLAQKLVSQLRKAYNKA
jgi:hypothetical protein